VDFQRQQCRKASALTAMTVALTLLLVNLICRSILYMFLSGFKTERRVVMPGIFFKPTLETPLRPSGGMRDFTFLSWYG
jgi:hypothetical protein